MNYKFPTPLLSTRMESLSDIYKEYGKMVYNLALQYVNNVSDAEEITQDVFMLVYEKLDTFRGESSLKTWIYRLTINKSLDYIKQKQSKKRWAFFSKNRVDLTDLDNSVATFDHPGVLLEDKEALSKLFSLINKLPENQRTVLILLKIEDLSMEEVMTIMELSYKAVESVFQRAKKKLKDLITQAKENE